MHRRLAVARIGTRHHVVVNGRGVVYHLHHRGGQMAACRFEPGVDAGTEKDARPDTLAARRDDYNPRYATNLLSLYRTRFMDSSYSPNTFSGGSLISLNLSMPFRPDAHKVVCKDSERIRLRPPSEMFAHTFPSKAPLQHGNTPTGHNSRDTAVHNLNYFRYFAGYENTIR